MKPEDGAWDSFLETGKIDDYLGYCQNRKQEMYAATIGGAVTPDAADHRWDYPQGYQNRRG